MHEARFYMKPPQRDGTQLVRGVRGAGLNDTVAGAHIVQQEIAIRVKDLVPSSCGNGIAAAVYYRSRRIGGKTSYMTRDTSNRIE